MNRTILVFFLLFFSFGSLCAQDTFSIVAVDTVTGEVGSAGASCVDLILFFPNYAIDFLGDLIPGVGAINSQASYLIANQNNARTRMLAGDNPQQIISWLVANDVQSNPAVRQYGIAAFVGDSVQTANHTGINCLNYKNHITGPTYCIQGNILLGQSVLDSMEARFLREPGDLACKLMAALQGAKVIGADTRCANNNSSSLFAFVKVSQPNDPYGSPSFTLGVKTPGGFQLEPIDSLQQMFDAVRTCASTEMDEILTLDDITVYPVPAGQSLHVDFKKWFSNEVSYELRDMQNRLLLDGKFTNRSQVINTSSLTKGTYLFSIEKSGRKIWRRILVGE
ncbi:MAG: DUF1028 domain-containing protein [Bacteroidota bacterium]